MALAEYFSDVSTTADSVPQGDIARQAVDSLRGYAYQVLVTTLAWLNLDKTDRLYMEVAEDYAVIAKNALNVTQIKDTRKSGSVTLNSESVQNAITSFVNLVEQNPDLQVNLHFFTTSEIGVERNNNDLPDGMEGLKYWRKVASGADPSPLRAILEGEKFSESVRRFSKDLDDADLRGKLIGRVHWDCGKPDFSTLRQELEECLVSVGREQFSLAAQEALRLADYLFCWVLKRSIADAPQDRVLTQADLYRAIDAATRVSVPRRSVDNLMRHAAGIVGLHGGGMGSGNSLSTERINWLIDGTTLPVLQGVISRTAVESEITAVLENYGAGVLVGSSGVGKSTVSRMVAVARAGAFFIVDFRNTSVDETRHQLDAFFARMGKLPLSALILEDLDHLDNAHVALSITRVIEASHRHDHEVLITCHRRPLRSGLIRIGLNPDCVVVCPDFSEEEVGALVRENRGDPKVWGRLAYIAGGFGHPQLVDAFVAGMVTRGWAVGEIEGILGHGFSSEDIDAARDAARRGLVDVLPEQARNLLYRLSLTVGPFNRALALTVGDLTPSTVQAGEYFDQLVGPWIEPVGSDNFRVSPLAKDFGREMLALDEQKRIHKIIATHMSNKDVVDTSDCNAMMIHALIGESPEILINLANSVLSAGVRTQETLAEHLFPFRFFQTNAPIYPENPLVSGMLRLAQFKLTAVTHEEDRISEIATALFNEVDSIPESDARHMFEAMVLIHVLCTMGIADYLDNWITLLTRFKSIVKTNSFLQDIVTNIEETSSADSHFYSTLFGIGSVDFTSVAKLEHVINELDKLDPSERAFWLTPKDKASSDHSVLINSPWAAAQQCPETFDAADAITRYQRMAEKTRNWGIRALFLQCSVAQAVILDEFQDDQKGAISILNEAIESHGSDPILSRALTKVYFRISEYEAALRIFHSIADEVGGDNPVERAFALREAAICAAKSTEWSQAESWFRDAQNTARQASSGDMPVMAIGLGADAAVVSLMGGDENRSLTYLAKAVEALANINPEATLQAAHCHRVVRHAVLWLLSRITGDDVKVNGRPITMEAGQCSNPEPLPVIKERPLGHIDLAWYMLAEAEISAGLDVGIASTLEDRLEQGLIPGMEISLRLQRIQKDIDRLDAVGFSDHFIEYVEVSVFLSQNAAQEKALCDPLNPERGKVPTLGKNPPFDPVAERAARDAIFAYGICSSLENQPEAMAHLKSTMENHLADPFPGKSAFGDWVENPASPTDLEQTVISIAKMLLKNEHVTPRNFCVAGLRLFEWAPYSNFQNLLISRLAVWQRSGWERILTNETFRLSTPRQTMPLIREALEIPENNKSFLAKLFLVTSGVVQIPLDQKYQDNLEAMAEET